MCGTSLVPPPPPPPLQGEHHHHDQHDHHHSTPAETLLARLDDPVTAAALHDLLDNAELLALLAGMVNGLVRRSETITANLAEGLADVRTAATAATGGAGVRAAAGDLGPLLAVLPAALPALRALLDSRLARPETIGALATVSGALVEGLAETPAPRRTGVRSLLADLREPETSRGLATLLRVARALGRRTAA